MFISKRFDCEGHHLRRPKGNAGFTPSHVALKICWVPAHVGIEDNEHADFLADLGSTASANGRMDVNRQQGVASTPLETAVSSPAPGRAPFLSGRLFIQAPPPSLIFLSINFRIS